MIYFSITLKFTNLSLISYCQVQKVDLPSYNENIDYPYISYKSIKYPKPGTPNPTVELHVVDLPGSDGRSNDEGQNSYLLLPPTIIRQR